MTLGSQAYGEPSYWDRRYSQEQGPFDWYQKYSSLAPLINLYVPPSSHVLVVGCGNSAFSEGLADDGYEDITSVDISAVVIEAMQKKYSNRPQLKYIKMDVRDMSSFQTGSFDAVIDKGMWFHYDIRIFLYGCLFFGPKVYMNPPGTLDSILCGNDSRQNSSLMLKEVGRVLKDRGVYILITYGAPSYRLDLLRSSCKWTVKLHLIEKIVSGVTLGEHKWELTNPMPLDEEGKPIEDVTGKGSDVHYIYVCTKDDSLTQGEKD